MSQQSDIIVAAVSVVPARVRILTVDDHPFFRAGLITWIERQHGFVSCGYADSPDSAVEAIVQQHPDLVLLDLQLRGGDGFDLLRVLKERGCAVKVIVISHKDEATFAERTIRAGAHGYVLKDEAIDVMLSAIQEVLEGHIHLSATMRRQLGKVEMKPGNSSLDKVRTLYNRELQVLELLGQGRTTKEIAESLRLSPKTVEFYRESLKKKLGLADSLSLVRFATLWKSDQRLMG